MKFFASLMVFASVLEAQTYSVVGKTSPSGYTLAGALGVASLLVLTTTGTPVNVSALTVTVDQPELIKKTAWYLKVDGMYLSPVKTTEKEITFAANNLISVPPNSSKEVSVEAVFPQEAAGRTIHVRISAGGIETTTSTYLSSLLENSEVTVANGTLSTVSITSISNQNFGSKFGNTLPTVGTFVISVTNRVVWLTGLTLTFSDSHVSKVNLTIDGLQVGTIRNIVGPDGLLTYNLSGAPIILYPGPHTLRVEGVTQPFNTTVRLARTVDTLLTDPDYNVGIVASMAP